MVNANNISIVNAASRTVRKERKPQHVFSIRQRPYAITPFMIAPVLAGETLKNALLQARVVSDPIKNPLMGWWYEHYIFYVAHSHLLDGWPELCQEMVLDPAFVASSNGMTSVGTSETNYTFVGGVDWVTQCLKSVVAGYFRDEGEAYDVAFIGGYPEASISGNNWMDSLVLHSAFDDPDINVDLNADETIMASELEKAQRLYAFAVQNNLTKMTYEDYLATFGVRSALASETANRPELIRFSRDWTYPSNTIDPSDGSAASACSWSISERADKARFFKEPGFIFGVCVARPKIYMKGQVGAAVGAMDDAFSWLPATLRQDATSRLKQFAGGFGPVPSVTSPYWIDVADLLTYGDQFVNFVLTATDAGLVALPTAAAAKKYAASADVDALFAAASPANQVRSDGIVSLSIASTIQDMS